jgi:signal transduction histidine kinase
MIDIRTLLFANATVFTVLAIAMLLVWRSNPRLPGLVCLARVHPAMVPGSILIGLGPQIFPAPLSAVLGNGLVVLGTLWLLRGIRRLYGAAEDCWPRWALLAWAAGLLTFLWIEPSLRGRILTNSIVPAAFVLRAAWTARSGLRRPEDRGSSVLVLGSLGMLGGIFALRCVSVATAAQVNPLGTYAFTVALLVTSLVAGTGWTLGVMNLVYARLNAELSRDVAKRQHYELALEELVQVAAHELRNPLTSIFGTLQLLSARADLLSEEDKGRLLAVARRNSERMVNLVNNLLDLERLESNQASFEIRYVDLEQQLIQARELTEGHASRCEVAIELAPLPSPGPTRVMADPQRLQQVLANLLSNAVKFSPPGATVRLVPSRQGNRMRVEVSDEGPGIPKELRPRIFGRFVRGETPASGDEDRKGSGLGLAISKQLVERMGGRIGFETGDRLGTTFYFELPAEAT